MSIEESLEHYHALFERLGQGQFHFLGFRGIVNARTAREQASMMRALAKALTTYAKANPAFTFRAGFVEGRVIDIKSITELASMPSKEEILSKLLFLINAPAQRLLTAMNAVGRNLAVVIDQGCKENKFQQ